ncbi:hypothetical protein BH09VER1_BH09VER1_18750 [soil metagenome]
MTPGTPTISLRQLREKYAQGVNIMAYLRETLGVSANTPEIVLQSYDLQAGSYVAGFDDYPEDSPGKVYRREVASILANFPADSVMEAGIGEATTLFYTARQFPSARLFGFDISWSRLAVAREFLRERFVRNVALATGDLFSIPLPDSSVDLVYTSHSIEPNGGREVEAIRELYRVARRWLVLIEPSSELGGEASQRRIDQHGYCRDLVLHAQSLGLSIAEHRLLDCSARAENQSALIVIKKSVPSADAEPRWACPACRTVLEEVKGHLYCGECLSVYPQLDGIPCLLRGNSVIASRYKE